MGSAACTGTDVSTSNPSNAFRMPQLKMANILDDIPNTPVLETDDWPRSETRKEWFAITRRIIQDTIADMDLDPAAEAEVIEAFTGAGLL